uniref:Uncharacterized protein n=1 Tax=Rhizophora mucronata TaxID=61149 RepID=A0A2P2J3C2_RHIMU
MPLKRVAACNRSLPRIQPLHCHDQLVIQHCLVRRPNRSPPQQLRRCLHQLFQRVR